MTDRLREELRELVDMHTTFDYREERDEFVDVLIETFESREQAAREEERALAPCRHEARKHHGRHEWYVSSDSGAVCRACGAKTAELFYAGKGNDDE